MENAQIEYDLNKKLRDEDPGKFLTIREVAEKFRFSIQKVYMLISTKSIPHYKFGNQVRFKREELDSWATNQRNEIKKGEF